MGNNRSKVPDLEKLVKGGRKKFVRYEEGAMLYSMGVHTFQQLKAAETSAEGISIYTHCPKGKVSMAYMNLTQEVMSDEK